MIIETDFPDHWKTSALVEKCQPQAVLCLLRLWAFCQLRKTDSIEKAQVEHIAKWDGKKDELLNALCAVGFLTPTDSDSAVFHDFFKVNKRIVARWENGKKGGRPRNLQITERKPTDNLQITERKPTDNRTEPKNPKDKETEKRESFPPHPPYKEKKEKETESLRARNLSKIDFCIQNFKEQFDKMNVNVSEQERESIFNVFAEWVNFRFFTIKEPLQPQTATFHAKRVVKCLLEDFLTVNQVVELFNRSIESEWQGWYFKEDILKLKAFSKKNNLKTPPPLGVPAGAWDYNEDTVL